MDVYLIWSNEYRMWWGEGGHGYTRDLAKAGRYSRKDAIKHSSIRDQYPKEPLPELPICEKDVEAILQPHLKSALAKG